jgi:hypothetical protein
MQVFCFSKCPSFLLFTMIPGSYPAGTCWVSW